MAEFAELGAHGATEQKHRHAEQQQRAQHERRGRQPTPAPERPQDPHVQRIHRDRQDDAQQHQVRERHEDPHAHDHQDRDQHDPDQGLHQVFAHQLAKRRLFHVHAASWDTGVARSSRRCSPA
jgi:hypothetical protein